MKKLTAFFGKHRFWVAPGVMLAIALAVFFQPRINANKQYAISDKQTAIQAAEGIGVESAGDEAAVTAPAPSTRGWVIEIEGYHFHNSASELAVESCKPRGDVLEDHVLKTMVHKLETGTVLLPLVAP